MSVQIRYVDAELTSDELSQELREFFEHLVDPDSAVKADAAAAGVDLAELRASGDRIGVKGSGAGLSGLEEALIIYLAEKALEAAWEHVISPWIQRRRGGKALGEKADPAAPA